MASDEKGKGRISSERSEWDYRRWYERNKKELAKKRKSRYHEDDGYRQRVLEQNKSYREKKARERAEQPKPKVRIPKHRRPVEMVVRMNGHTAVVQLVHVGAFARAIGRSVATIHQWERCGLLPRTPYLSKGGKKEERLYTEDMIRVVMDVLSTRGKSVPSSDPTFRQEVIDGWEEAGITVSNDK